MRTKKKLIMNNFLLVLLIVDTVLALSLILFVILRSHKRFYKTESEHFEPVHSIEADELRKDQTPLVIGDLDFSYKNKPQK